MKKAIMPMETGRYSRPPGPIDLATSSAQAASVYLQRRVQGSEFKRGRGAQIVAS